jgi:hypothetical protein
MDDFRTKLGKVGDLERRLSKVFTYSIRHSVKAIYFENISFTKLKEFKHLLRHFKEMRATLTPLRAMIGEFKS